MKLLNEPALHLPGFLVTAFQTTHKLVVIHDLPHLLVTDPIILAKLAQSGRLDQIADTAILGLGATAAKFP